MEYDFKTLTNYENLYRAHRKCRSGKLWKDSVAHYELTALESTAYLQYLLKTKRYKIGKYYCFTINERGKRREIKSARYKDRVVQRCLHDNIIIPLIMPHLIYENGASREDKGTDFQLELLKRHLQEEVRKNGPFGYVLTIDIRHYFDSIRHDKLHEIYSRYITDPDVMALIDSIHESIPGGVGTPLGNHLSQTDALVLLNEVDHYIKEQLHIRGYGRYNDDSYLISHDREYLKHCLLEITKLTGELGLTLHPTKTKIVSMQEGFNFLGFHFYVTESGKVIMRIKAKAKSRERSRIRKHKKKVDEGVITFKDALASYMSWRAHADRGDTYYMLQEMDLYFYSRFEDYLDNSQRYQLKTLRKRSEARKRKRRNNINGKTSKQPPRGDAG